MILFFFLQKDENEQAASVKNLPNDKSAKAPEVLRYAGREMQVEALVKKLPQLRPRGSIPEKPLLSVHAPAPAFSPNDSSSVQVTLPITVATLPPQQHGSALPLMILPPVTVSTATPVTTASKRAPDPSVVPVGPPLKRKRGRPRKQRPEETAPAQNLNLNPNQKFSPNPNQNLSPNPLVLNRGVIQKALSSSSTSSSLQVTETVLQCKVEEPEAQPVMLLQEAGRAMVIQRAPVLRENRPVNQQLPPPTVHEDRGVVELTLTPIEPLVTAAESVCGMPQTSPGEGGVP